MATLNFNAAAVPPSDSFDPILAGWYTGIIEEAELKPTSAGTGSYIALKVKVQGPTNTGRIVFANITYSNPNEKAIEIGHRQISAICHALGVMNLTDTNMLCGRPLQFKVKIKPAEGQYEARNEITGWKAVDGAAPAVAAPAAPAAPAAAKPAAAAPWY